MCFSATASFAASGVTGVAGVAAVVSTRSRAWLPLALVPLLFAAHQAGEGIEWLAMSGHASSRLEVVGMYGFEIVAKVVWPFWVPLVALLLEPDRRRWLAMQIFLAVGVLESIAMAFSLVALHPSAQILGGHIDYNIGAPAAFITITATVYPLVVTLPLLISSRTFLRMSGIVLLVVAGATQLLYAHGQGSVWCFFDAWVSVLIIFVLRSPAAATTDALLARTT